MPSDFMPADATCRQIIAAFDAAIERLDKAVRRARAEQPPDVAAWLARRVETLKQQVRADRDAMLAKLRESARPAHELN